MHVPRKDFVKYTRDDKGKDPSQSYAKGMVRISDKSKLGGKQCMLACQAALQQLRGQLC